MGINALPSFLVLALGLSFGCLGQDLCSLPEQARGFAPPPTEDAYAVLDRIGAEVPFNTRTIRLFPSSDNLVKRRGGAAAKLCGATASERWIFYDPTYIEKIKQTEGSEIGRYFVLAHEAAHHFNGDTLTGSDWSKDQELSADQSAASWLTKLGVSHDQLLATFEALGLPVNSVNGYPTRAERRAMIEKGYEKASKGPTRQVLFSNLSSPSLIYGGLLLGEIRENPPGHLPTLQKFAEETAFTFKVLPGADSTFTGGRIAALFIKGTNAVDMSLREDDAGRPSTLIETVRLTGVLPDWVDPSKERRGAAPATFSSNTFPKLLAGRSYWVTVRVPFPDSSIMWCTLLQSKAVQANLTPQGWITVGSEQPGFEIIGIRR